MLGTRRNQQPSGWQDLRGDLDLGSQLLRSFLRPCRLSEIDAEILKEHAKSLERISRALDTDAAKGNGEPLLASFSIN